MAGPAADSRSRAEVRVGAGWNEREHDAFGFDLLPVPERFARFEEALEVITRLVRQDGPVSFEGDYYRTDQATVYDRPETPVPIYVAAGGPQVARYAGRAGDVDRFLQHRDGVGRGSESGEGPPVVIQHRGQSPPVLECTEPGGGVRCRGADTGEIGVIRELFHPDERGDGTAPVIAQVRELIVGVL